MSRLFFKYFLTLFIITKIFCSIHKNIKVDLKDHYNPNKLPKLPFNPQNPFRNTQAMPTSEEEENAFQIITITVTKIKIKNTESGQPVFEVTVIRPEMDKGESYEDSPSLVIRGNSDNIDFENTFECAGFSDNELTTTCSSKENKIYGSYQNISIESTNMLFSYDLSTVKILSEKNEEIKDDYFYFFFGIYSLSENQKFHQDLDEKTHDVVLQLKDDYNGEVFFFNSDGDTRERLECQAIGTKEVNCYGGVVDFNNKNILFYYSGNNHTLINSSITVLNKYSISVRSAIFPDYEQDKESCSSIYIGYKFNITLENHGFTDLNTSEVIEIELENNSDGQITSIPAECTIPSASSVTFDCKVLRAGKGGKTYYLKEKSGEECINFNGGGNCIYIHNVKDQTKINPGYSSIDADKTVELVYNKELLKKDDYPKIIRIYFKDEIAELPTKILAGEVSLNDCAIGKSKLYFYCNIYEGDLTGIEGSTSYNSYEMSFYDVCGNFRMGPTIKVAGIKSDDTDENEEEKERILKNSKENYLNVRIWLVICLIFGVVGMI